jgi:hypothetical protein
MVLLYIKAAFIFTSLISFLIITNPSIFKRAFILAIAKVNFNRSESNHSNK